MCLYSVIQSLKNQFLSLKYINDFFKKIINNIIQMLDKSCNKFKKINLLKI